MKNDGVPLHHQTPWNLENLRGAINLGGQAIKSLEIVNGAAAIGVLTFYGNAAEKAVGRAIDLGWLRAGLIAFAGGVALSIITSICAYISQILAATRQPSLGEIRWRIVALVFGIGSAAMFVSGVVFVAIAF
jgi:hypothetical protein